MDIEISFPGGKRVDARVGHYLVQTDQPVELGGGGAAISPFELFLASLATCAGLYVLAFCQARSIATDGVSLRQCVDVDEVTKLPSRIRLQIGLPPSFPEKYRAGIGRAAEGCKVKKTIAAAPRIEVVVMPVQAVASA
jgi:putative redox protein